MAFYTGGLAQLLISADVRMEFLKREMPLVFIQRSPGYVGGCNWNFLKFNGPEKPFIHSHEKKEVA